MTNFGKRRQICAAPAFWASCDCQRVAATIDSTKAHTPIQISRPMTFMSVKALTAASALPAMPATLPAIAAIGLRRGQTRGIGQFRGSDPGAGHAGCESQAARHQRQHEDQHDGPEHHQRNRDRRNAPSSHPPRR